MGNVSTSLQRRQKRTRGGAICPGAQAERTGAGTGKRQRLAKQGWDGDPLVAARGAVVGGALGGAFWGAFIWAAL